MFRSFHLAAALLPVLFLFSSCATDHPAAYTGPLPHGAISSGTLASSDLISEAKKNIPAAMQASGYSAPSDLSFTAFLTKAPSGPDGSIRWQEQWFFHSGGEQVVAVIDFHQTGAAGTEMNIRVPEKKTR